MDPSNTPQHNLFELIENFKLEVKPVTKRTYGGVPKLIAWQATPTTLTPGFDSAFKQSATEVQWGQSVHDAYIHTILSPFPSSLDFPKSKDNPTDLVTYMSALMPYVMLRGWESDEKYKSSGYAADPF